MTFLAELVADIVEWLMQKGGTALWIWLSSLWAEDESNVALEDNQAALQTAIKSGDPKDVQNAGQNSLNNSGGN